MQVFASSNGVRWRRDYLFVWPIADVWKTCSESVIISAIPFNATKAETTHCSFKHIYLINESVNFDSHTNKLTSPTTTTFTETHVSVNLKTPGTCHALSFSRGARAVIPAIMRKSYPSYTINTFNRTRRHTIRNNSISRFYPEALRVPALT